jgi:tRNA G18 (ribose-2'-O)-methylase SpoU
VMNVQHVTEADDPRVDDYRSLTDVGLRRRREPEQGLFMAESHQVIGRAMAAGYPVRSVLTTPRWQPAVEGLFDDPSVRGEGSNPPVFVAEPDVVARITGYRVHRGALAAMDRVPLPTVSEVMRGASRVVVLEGIVDHTNVGAIFRSAAGLGFDAVLVDPTCADPLYRRSVRVSMGAVFSLPWTRLTPWPSALTTLAERGWEVVALTPRAAAEPLASVAAEPLARIALLLGSEGPGLSEAALSAVTRHVRIPMADGVDSLNVAAAVAVACYEFGAASRPPTTDK